MKASGNERDLAKVGRGKISFLLQKPTNHRCHLLKCTSKFLVLLFEINPTSDIVHSLLAMTSFVSLIYG
jgi:hypothetical protein